MWGQPKTSSCCLCVWCKSKELQGREEVQDSQHQWWKASPQIFFQLWKVIGQSHIQNFVKHQRHFTLRKYVERLQMIALMMVILMVFYTYGELILRGVDPILGNGQNHPPELLFTKRCSQKFRKIHRKKSVTEKHFPVDFAKFLRKPLFQNISERLLLNGYGVQGQLLQESEMLAKLQSSNLQSRKYQSKISSFCF